MLRFPIVHTLFNACISDYHSNHYRCACSLVVSVICKRCDNGKGRKGAHCYMKDIDCAQSFLLHPPVRWKYISSVLENITAFDSAFCFLLW